jgi:HSP20 family protein
MATDDKSRQQSAYIPGSGTQQGAERKDAGTQAQRYEGRSLYSPRRAPAVDPYRYTTSGSSPFGLMQRLSEDMDRLFENFGLGGLFPRTTWPGGVARYGALESVPTLWSPHIEMFEQDGKLVVQADLPGLQKEDVHAQIEDDAIILSGERQQETKKNESGTYLSERAYGSFYRVIPLPEGVDAATATATFRDGVLHIEMASPKRQRGRTLEISDAGDTGRTAQQQASGARSGTGTQQSSGPGSTKQAGSS